MCCTPHSLSDAFNRTTERPLSCTEQPEPPEGKRSIGRGPHSSAQSVAALGLGCAGIIAAMPTFLPTPPLVEFGLACGCAQHRSEQIYARSRKHASHRRRMDSIAVAPGCRRMVALHLAHGFHVGGLPEEQVVAGPGTGGRAGHTLRVECFPPKSRRHQHMSMAAQHPLPLSHWTHGPKAGAGVCAVSAVAFPAASGPPAWHPPSPAALSRQAPGRPDAARQRYSTDDYGCQF